MYLKHEQPQELDPAVPDRPARPRRPGDRPKPGPRPGPKYRNPVPPPGGPIQPRPWKNPKPWPGLGGVGGMAGGIGLGFGVAEFLDDWVPPSKDPFPFKHQLGGWYYRCDADRQPGAPPYSPNNTGPYVEFFAGKICNLNSGQVPSGSRRKLEPYVTTDFASDSAQTMILSDSRLTPALRMRHDWVWNRDNTGYRGEGTWRPTTWPGLGPALDPMPNPNIARNRGPDPQPAPPEPVPGEGRTPDPQEWQWNSMGPPNPPPRPHVRNPPKPTTKEQKAISRAAKIGIFLWRLMDTISELTEIGGAIYQALPEEIRKKANCGSGVNIGQYGSDVNACMVETLFKHWDKLDTAKAVREIAKNIVEDMSVGAFHKWLGKVTPPGVSLEKTLSTTAIASMGVEKYIAMKLNELFEALGV